MLKQFRTIGFLGCHRRTSLGGLSLAVCLLGLAGAPVRPQADPLITDQALNPWRADEPLVAEGQRPNPADFEVAELQELQRRFGVHGPQTPLAQLFTAGLDHWAPLRTHTLQRLEQLMPAVRREAKSSRVNPMLLTAVLYDELQHAKPGEDSALAMRSGLFQTHGPAQLGVEELMHQHLLPRKPSQKQLEAARQQLLDPERNVALLAGKMARLSRSLGVPNHGGLEASTSPRDAHLIATLAYLHNGKLDYPNRILNYMQDPALHGLLYGRQEAQLAPLI